MEIHHDSLTEIKPNGEVVMVQETPEEGDITDEKSMVFEETQPTPEDTLWSREKLVLKPTYSSSILQNNSKPFCSGFGASVDTRPWAKREQMPPLMRRHSLLREGEYFRV